MESTQIQKDKLELIEKIIHLDDEIILANIKVLLNHRDPEYVLTEEQKNEVRESAEKYFSGEDKGRTWEEVNQRIRNKK